MNFYEQIFSRGRATGEGMTHFERLFAAKFGGSPAPEVREYTGPVPVTITADGTPLIDYLISGNTTQSGTPTPDAPIIPEGCGERTGNLFDEVYSDISGTIRYRPIFVGDGTFTLSTTTPYDSNVANVFLLSGNVSSGASTTGNGAWKNHNVTAQSVDGYVTIAYRHYSGTTSPADCLTMLNLGSTALPYEPWGVKILISSASTTAPVYLGDVESTRRIKKLVLTGEETSWQSTSASEGRNRFTLPILNAMQADTAHFTSLSTHLPLGVEGTTWNTDDVYTIVSSKLYMRLTAQYNTLADFKSYLAQQYAAGTPVTVWYVLAESETGIVNEPLMKIGEYADTLSKSQAGVEIPTVSGSNTLDVNTTVKPSEVYIKYMGR